MFIVRLRLVGAARKAVHAATGTATLFVVMTTTIIFWPFVRGEVNAVNLVYL